jgi:hypothetical protein
MSEHWWHDDDPKAVEARQIIFGLQSELAQAKEELTRLRAQVNRTSLGHAQHPSRFRFIPEELTWRKHEANARRMGGATSPPLHGHGKTKMSDLLQAVEPSGLAVCATDKETVEAQTTGDGSMANGGSTSTGTRASQTILAGMKTASKCMGMANGTMFTHISAAQQCTNSPPDSADFFCRRCRKRSPNRHVTTGFEAKTI